MLEELIKELNNYTIRAYYVGGYVRDKILGIESKDIDIEVFNIEPEKLEQILSKFGSVQKVGKSYGVYKLENIDISIPRSEVKVGNSHKDFDITLNPYSSIDDAVKRRDFTINALYQNIFSGAIFNNYNGLDDLNKRLIKHVDSKTFLEDPLRVFRAAQFAARFNFSISYETFLLCKQIDVNHLPFERIFEEIKKALLKSKSKSLYFSILVDILGEDQFRKFIGFDYNEEKLNKINDSNITKENLDYFIAYLYKDGDYSHLTNKQKRIIKGAQLSNSFDRAYFNHFNYPEIIDYHKEVYGLDLDYYFSMYRKEIPTSEEIINATKASGKDLGCMIQMSRELALNLYTKKEILTALKKKSYLIM